MAYRLEDGEGMAQGVRRIVAQQVKGAIEQLEGEGDRSEGVHDARKRLKKTRSAMRLVRDDLGNRRRRKENVVLRDAGRGLSGVRDAQVLVKTLDGVASDEQLPESSVRELRAILDEQRVTLEAETHDGGGAEAVARELAVLHERIGDWPLEDQSFDSAAKGLRRIHRRGARAMKAALDKGDDESWHEWRKRVKDLWYATRILQPVSPQLDGMVEDADQLSDVLGDHNDLAVLAATVDQHEGEIGPEAAETVRRAVFNRRDALRRMAVPLGKRLYGENSKALAARLKKAWRARSAERLADARWVDPEAAEEIRALIAARCATKGAERARITATLRRRGWGVASLAKSLGRSPDEFSAEDWDELLKTGKIRIGDPPDAEVLARKELAAAP